MPGLSPRADSAEATPRDLVSGLVTGVASTLSGKNNAKVIPITTAGTSGASAEGDASDVPDLLSARSGSAGAGAAVGIAFTEDPRMVSAAKTTTESAGTHTAEDDQNADGKSGDDEDNDDGEPASSAAVANGEGNEADRSKADNRVHLPPLPTLNTTSSVTAQSTIRFEIVKNLFVVCLYIYCTVYY